MVCCIVLKNQHYHQLSPLSMSSPSHTADEWSANPVPGTKPSKIGCFPQKVRLKSVSPL